MEELLPNKYFIKFFLGLSRLSSDEPLEAFRYLEQSLALEPKKEDIPSIYSYMGVCLRDLENYTEAIKILENGSQEYNDRTDINNLLILA